ncbi:YolD-like family protein [Psychrobacillus sp. FJAT-51614]|uniref:YolD-like family protein n=1 Tax=Psychrobacillus mangrovi TaxID=3117745 RepID=A0ABU8F2Z6_9BACI
MSSFDDFMHEKLDLSKVQDRGSKKWVAMMLPEHLKLIRQYNDDSKKIPKPELNEWDLEAIQESIELAMKRNVEVKLKIWKAGEFTIYVGKVIWVDLNRRVIEMEDTFQSFSLRLDEIVDITVLE